MGTSGLPDMYIRCSRVEGGHIRKTMSAHLTTVMYHSPNRLKALALQQLFLY